MCESQVEREDGMSDEFAKNITVFVRSTFNVQKLKFRQFLCESSCNFSLKCLQLPERSLCRASSLLLFETAAKGYMCNRWVFTGHYIEIVFVSSCM